MIAEKIEGANEVTEYFLPRDHNHFCAGCYKCIENTSACPHYSEKKVIIDSIDAADVLIVTTPTYCLHMSAPLKAFFDLTFDMWMSHRPMESMFSKKAVIVSTSAGASTKKAIKDVQDALFYMGIPEIIKYGIAVQAMAIAKRISSGKTPTVGLRTRFLFGMMGMMHKSGWNSSPIETDYWKENGWLDGKKPWKN